MSEPVYTLLDKRQFETPMHTRGEPYVTTIVVQDQPGDIYVSNREYTDGSALWITLVLGNDDYSYLYGEYTAGLDEVGKNGEFFTGPRAAWERGLDASRPYCHPVWLAALHYLTRDEVVMRLRLMGIEVPHVW